MIQKEPSLFDL